LILLQISLFSQVLQGFNYQAIARDGSGNPLIGKDNQFRVSILSGTTGFYSSGGGVCLWEEQHPVRQLKHQEQYSVAIGNNITANTYGELAMGQWNETVTGTSNSWDENDLLLSVGNGVNDANRSNAIVSISDTSEKPFDE
jgi:hypothetical protein